MHLLAVPFSHISLFVCNDCMVLLLVICENKEFQFNSKCLAFLLKGKHAGKELEKERTRDRRERDREREEFRQKEERRRLKSLKER